MTNQSGLLQAGCIQYGNQPISQLFYYRHRRSVAAAMTGHVQGQDAMAMPGEITGLQFPHRMIRRRAMYENDGGQFRIKGLATRSGVDLAAIDIQLHGSNSCLSNALAL